MLRKINQKSEIKAKTTASWQWSNTCIWEKKSNKQSLQQAQQ